MTRFHMGEIVRREARLQAALAPYLEVLYLDMNGPRNTGGYQGIALVGPFAAFMPTQGFIAPGVVSRALDLISRLHLTVCDVRAQFEQATERPYQDLRLPVSPEQAWKTIEPQLSAEQGT